MRSVGLTGQPAQRHVSATSARRLTLRVIGRNAHASTPVIERPVGPQAPADWTVTIFDGNPGAAHENERGN
ncbi:MAG: hypothetical protein LC808_05820 [Actinobacteria bacterium]|nr:hypothetical protein [Actinomycetota bacterium]